VADPGAEAVALLAELVGIDSVNPGLVPGAAGEERIAEHLRARLERAGFAVTVVPARGQVGRPSLVVVPPGSPDRPGVVLCGHLDTVGVTGMSEPFTPRVEGERLYGRGAADMKGGIAALVVAAERLVATDAPVRPVLALVADEEDASLGSEAVIEALPALDIRPEVCLIGEPTDLALARSLRGFAVVKVTFAGRAAHTSQPERGVNAVTHLGRFLQKVDEQGDLMVTVVRGGESPFVVPDHAECIVELRTLPGETTDALENVRALLEPEWQAESELIVQRDGWRFVDVPFADRLGAELGTEATFDAPYWLEASLWQHVCPTVVCGPSGGGLHAIDEWVDLGQVRAFTAAVIAALSSL